MNQSLGNLENQWRLETPGESGWARSVRPGADRKYFMVSCDTHLTPPITLFSERLPAEYLPKLPRQITDEKGVKYQVFEGARPQRVVDALMTGEDKERNALGRPPASEEEAHKQVAERIEMQERDGVDADVLFPNGYALYAYWIPDPAFQQSMMRIYNDWAAEVTKPWQHRLNVAAGVGTADVDSAVAEVQRVAKMGYRSVCLPNKPIFGPSLPEHINYNLPHFDPLWAAIQDADLTITFHVSTGSDPRTARGHGAAIVNYVVHAMSTTAEPVCNLCSSGVLERFPKLRFASVEAGCGWVPWFLNAMDEAYRKHHFWVRPKLKMLPSEFFREHGAATFADDPAGMHLVEAFGLENNFMWANDYPHHEGTWPYSAQSIERTMSNLSEGTRAKLLGLNAARLFRFDVPARYRQQA